MGFEPTNGGFADLSLGPLGYRAELASIANLGNIAGAPTSRFAEILPFLIGLGRSLNPRIAPIPEMPAPCRSCTFCYDALAKELPMLGSAHLLSFILSVLLAADGTIPPSVAPRAESLAMSPVIVIGFVGGFVKHDNVVHSEVQLATHLRQDYPLGVQVQVFENHRREKAHEQILQLLDTDHDGTLSAEEKQQARVIIYGHSWGGSETVTLARELEKDGIPVLLTIQVDSISKADQNDMVIPTNVAQAANFYQADGLLRGRPQIRAADAAHTQIIGNFRFDYKVLPVSCPLYPWFDRLFMKSHIEIECDPRVWNQVESLIRSKLPSSTRSASAKSAILPEVVRPSK